MADVFTVLAQDHQEVRAMLAELEKGPTRATGAGENQLALRKKMTETLIIEGSRHEALEEMYFWPAVREYHSAGDTLADEAAGQEQEAKHVLAELDKLQASDTEFEELPGKFIGAAREHIAFEENQVRPGLRSVLPAKVSGELVPRSPKARRPRPRVPIPARPPRHPCSRPRGLPWPPPIRHATRRPAAGPTDRHRQRRRRRW
jgi:hypothetical protein